ncbi:quinone-dependent dihydroorotate dehydrogenase [Catenulispora yoronensis]|uniref:quinone-dependent dihydroorotate dehydrogenase n=1 Tax=Catenulispora yoronensis TaxID=450799 RepID=UPI003CD0A8EB
MYPKLFNGVFRRMDAEQAHRLGFGAIRAVGALPAGVGLAVLERAFQARDTVLKQTVFGVDFPAPFGLAAGFDKNAEGIDALAALGFGSVEIGTVTGQGQPGNEQPRLARLIADRAVVNRMGFNNVGAVEVARRLKRRVAKPERWDKVPPVVGVNIGKTKAVPESEAAADYVASTRLLAPYADYLVVNVSSPNTPGLRNLQAVEVLRPLLTAVREAADQAVPGRKVPLLVKIAPDLADDDVDAVADLALELGLDGIIATNTTIGRDGLKSAAAKMEAAGGGGLSGAPLKARSLEVLRRLRARTDGRLALISVGGVETAADAWQRLVAGADLVQGYTGFIYEGPAWASRINRGIAAKVRSGGYTSLRDAVEAARVS